LGPGGVSGSAGAAAGASGTAGKPGSGGTVSLGGSTGAGAGQGGRAGAAGAGGSVGLGGMSGTGGSLGPGGAGGAAGSGIRLPPSVCNPNAVAGKPVSLRIEAYIDPGARFVAITPDELTLVWTVRESGSLAVTYLDRSTANADFDPPQSLVLDAGDDQVAMSPDGLQVVYVSADGQNFQVQARRGPGGEFADLARNDFSLLDGALSPGWRYAEPVYGSDAVSFYFAIVDQSGHKIRQASLKLSADEGFDKPSTLVLPGADANPELRVTGASADSQTLFVWDSVTGQTLWSFVDQSTLSYAPLKPLGQFGPAQPNQDCSRIYAGPTVGSVVSVPLE
jgi:hypothetical protein